MNRIIIISLVSSMLAVSGVYAASSAFTGTTIAGVGTGIAVKASHSGVGSFSPRRMVDLLDSSSNSSVSPSPVKMFTERLAREQRNADKGRSESRGSLPRTPSRLATEVSRSPIKDADRTRLMVEFSPVTIEHIGAVHAVRRNMDTKRAGRRHGLISAVVVPAAASPIAHSDRM